jgi:hypothetical protein
MYKLILVLLTIALSLMGCSSNSKWVKIDKSDFSPMELENALTSCKYREVMKRSNLAMLSTSSQVVIPYDSNEVKEELGNNRERVRLIEDKALEANNEIKQKSLRSASQAYMCVERKGFKRS